MISASAIEGHFKGKPPRKIHQGFFVIGRKYHSSRALAIQNKTGLAGYHSLDHPPYYPDLAPLQYQLFPGLKSK
jgi:hypothetical protein